MLARWKLIINKSFHVAKGISDTLPHFLAAQPKFHSNFYGIFLFSSILLPRPFSLRGNCLGSLKSTFHLLLAHLLHTKKASDPGGTCKNFVKNAAQYKKAEKKKCIKAKIPPEVAHFLLSLGTLKLTHKFSSGWPIACGRLSTRYFQSCQFFFFTKGV